jgi:putative DNA primase/helicase
VSTVEGLKWDGTERLSGWLTTYLGAPKSPLAAAIGRKFLISAVARIERPGCKVDHMLILEGYQGALKSKSLRTLVGDDWFTDHIADLGTKDSCQDLRGVWVIELSELAAIRPGEVERVKAYISRQVDHYRPSYGRRSIDVPRQCVFIGTTNDTEYLSDPTGGRRYWPVTCTALDPEALARDRDQVWAEAVAAYHAGETWWIDDDQLRRVAQEEQELRRIEDPWEAVVADWLDSPTRANSDGIRIPLELDGGRVAVQQILEHAIARPAERQTKSDQMRVGKILKLLGWSKSRAGKGRARMWEEVGLPSAASEPPSGPGDPPCDPANTEVVRPGGSTQTPRPERGTAEAGHLTHLSSCTGYAAETESMARGGPGGPPGRNGSAEREHVGTCAHCNFAVFADNMVRTESGALLHFPCADLWSREVPF